MMLGLRPTSRRSGKVNVLGFDPAREPLQAKRRVGYLLDSVGFYDHLTAIENLSYTAKLMGLSFPERSQRIADALSCVHLSDVAHKRVATFFARYAAANRVGRDHRQAGGDRYSRRADVGRRSPGHDRISRADRRAEARRHHRTAVVASARPGAAHLRPGGAVQPAESDGACGHCD